jgi:hypothetical protein
MGLLGFAFLLMRYGVNKFREAQDYLRRSRV